MAGLAFGSVDVMCYVKGQHPRARVTNRALTMVPRLNGRAKMGSKFRYGLLGSGLGKKLNMNGKSMLLSKALLRAPMDTLQTV